MAFILDNTIAGKNKSKNIHAFNIIIVYYNTSLHPCSVLTESGHQVGLDLSDITNSPRNVNLQQARQMNLHHDSDISYRYVEVVFCHTIHLPEILYLLTCLMGVSRVD